MAQFPKTDPFQRALHEHQELRSLNRSFVDFLAEPRPDPGAPDAAAWTSSLGRHLNGLGDRNAQ